MNKKRLAIIFALGFLTYFLLINPILFGGQEVLLEQVTRGDIEEFVEERGELILQDQEIIYSSFSGFIKEVHYEAGDYLDKNARIFLLESQEKDSMVLQRDSLNTQIKSMQRKLKNDQELLEKNLQLKEAGAISQKDYEDFYNILKDNEGQLENLKRELSYLNQSLNEGDLRVLSPINGLLLNNYVKKGDFIQRGSPLAMVGNMDRLLVDADLLTEDVVKIKEGDPVLISPDIDKTRQIEGLVSKIYPLAFSKSSDLGVEQKRVKVEIVFLEAQEDLRPGYQVSLKIITNKKDNIILIPENSLFKLDKDDHVFVVKNNKALLRRVETGLKSARQVEIISGLDENDLLILSPPSDLKDGGRVKGK